MKNLLELPLKRDIFGSGVKKPEEVLPVVYAAKTMDKSPGRFPAILAYEKEYPYTAIYVLSVEPLEQVTALYRNGQRVTDAELYEVYPASPVPLASGGTGPVMAWMKWKKPKEGRFSFDGYSTERNPVRVLESFLGKYAGLERSEAGNFWAALILQSSGIQANWWWNKRAKLPEVLATIAQQFGLWVFLDEHGRLCIRQGEWGWSMGEGKDCEEGWEPEEIVQQDAGGWIELLKMRTNHRYVPANVQWDVQAEAKGCGKQDVRVDLSGLWMSRRRARQWAERIRTFRNFPMLEWKRKGKRCAFQPGDWMKSAGKLYRILQLDWDGESGAHRVQVKESAGRFAGLGIQVRGLPGGVGNACVNGERDFIRAGRLEPVLFALCVPEIWNETVEWNFGDGSALTSGLSVLHSFAFSGKYWVKAKSQEDGEEFERELAVEVEEERAGQGFLIDARSGKRFRSVRLDGKVLPMASMSAISSIPAVWSWSVAGETISGQEVFQFFDLMGEDRIYSIELSGVSNGWAFSENRLRASISSPFVSEGKRIKIWVDEEGGTPEEEYGRNGIFYGTFPLTLHFRSNGENLTAPVYAWNFGDGGSSMDADPVHTYLQAGDYVVTLNVQDSGILLKDEMVLTLREMWNALAEYSEEPEVWQVMQGELEKPIGSELVVRLSAVTGGELPYQVGLSVNGSIYLTGECHTVQFSASGNFSLQFSIVDKNGQETRVGNLMVRVK